MTRKNYTVKTKTVPTKVLVKSNKKSSSERDVYVWRNISIVTHPTVITKTVYNEHNKNHMSGGYDVNPIKTVYIPDTSHLKSTSDLSYCGRRV